MAKNNDTINESNPKKWYYSPLLSWGLGLSVILFAGINSLIDNKSELHASEAVYKVILQNDIAELQEFDSVQCIKNAGYDKKQTELELIAKDFIIEIRTWRSDDDKKFGAITLMLKQLSGDRKDMKELLKYLDGMRPIGIFEKRDSLKQHIDYVGSCDTMLVKQIIDSINTECIDSSFVDNKNINTIIN